MADKFVDYETKVCANWLNAVDWAVYDALGLPKTPQEARENIGATEEAPTDDRAYVRYNASWQPLSIIQHNDMGGRDAANAHPISAITNLQTTLNGKAATSHTHFMSQVVDAGEMAWINDAPLDSKQYARFNGEWAVVSGGSGGDTDHRLLTFRDALDQHPIAAITDLQGELDLRLTDAPSDGLTYGRNNGAWQAVAGGGDGGDHSTLINRDIADQHPQSAITGLETRLSGIDTSLAGKQATITGAATTITSSNLTVSRAVVSDASGKVAVSAATAAEVGHLSGVTSGIQGQLDGKQATITGGATSIVSANLTASMALVSDALGKVAAHANVSATELGYLDGVTGAIQGQLDVRITDAPSDGKQYGRQSGSWTAIAAGDHSLLTNRNLADQHTIAAITGLQTALDAKQPLDADLSSIAGLSGTSGFLKKTAADSWSLDTSTYALSSHTHSEYLPTAGGTMSGNILMGGNDVRNLRLAAFNEGTIPPAANSTWYMYTMQKAKIDGLNQNMNLYHVTQGQETGHFQLRVTQDATGGWTLNLSYILPDGKWIGTAGQPTINTDPNGVTVITIYVVGGTPICGSVALVGK